MAVFNDANLEKAYQSIYGQLQGSGGYTPLSMPEQTLDSITEQLAGALRPQFERAIAQRYGATKEQKARIDVDAASRGMGSSTWVTDAKNRIMNAEAADIAGLESDYASQLAGDALNQYNNYLGDKLALDQYNQKLAQALGDDAYARVMQQLSAGLISPVSKGGGNPRGGDDGLDLDNEVPPIEEYFDPTNGIQAGIQGLLSGVQTQGQRISNAIQSGIQGGIDSLPLLGQQASGGVKSTKAFAKTEPWTGLTQSQVRR